MAQQKQDNGGLLPALDMVFAETVALFQRLRKVADEIHQHEDMPEGKRTILQTLDAVGAQTVPDLAEARGVSRQHVQKLVKPLEKEGFVQLVDNPAHKRSKFVELTEQGRELIENMDGQEARLLAQLQINATEEELRAVANTLGAVRTAFRSEAWRKLVENGGSE